MRRERALHHGRARLSPGAGLEATSALVARAEIQGSRFLKQDALSRGGYGRVAIGGVNLKSKTADVVLTLTDVRSTVQLAQVQGHAKKTDIGWGAGGGGYFMVTSKLSDAIIIHKIKNSKRGFDTSSAALVALTKAGVSEPVIMAMMEP